MARTKRTLWGHLKEKAKGPVEYRHTNPLKVKCGDPVMFDSVGYTEKVFTVQDVREVKRTMLGDEYVFSDYDLDHGVRLRYNDGKMILLEKAGEFGYDEEFHNEVLNGDANDLFHKDPEGVEHHYGRINDVTTPYSAETLTISDKDGNGIVEAEEVTKGSIEYWDYWREEESGRIYFVFVEMDTETGFFTIWDGFETHANLLQAGT